MAESGTDAVGCRKHAERGYHIENTRQHKTVTGAIREATDSGTLPCYEQGRGFWRVATRRRQFFHIHWGCTSPAWLSEALPSAQAAAREIVDIETTIGSTHIDTGTELMRSTNIVRFLSQLGMSLEESPWCPRIRPLTQGFRVALGGLSCMSWGSYT